MVVTPFQILCFGWRREFLNSGQLMSVYLSVGIMFYISVLFPRSFVKILHWTFSLSSPLRTFFYHEDSFDV